MKPKSNSRLSGPRATLATINVLLNIANELDVTDRDLCQLVDIAPAQFEAWKMEPPPSLPSETLVRMSHLFGIYKALFITLPAASARTAWLHNVNHAPVFKDRSPLEYMLDGDLERFGTVRNYLCADGIDEESVQPASIIE